MSDVELAGENADSVGVTKPAKIEIKVVLPAPLGPSKPKNSPGSMLKEISSRA